MFVYIYIYICIQYLHKPVFAWTRLPCHLLCHVWFLPCPRNLAGHLPTILAAAEMAPAQASELAQQLAKWNSAPQEPWPSQKLLLDLLLQNLQKLLQNIICAVHSLRWKDCLRSLFMGLFYICPCCGRPMLSCFWLLLYLVVKSPTVDLQEWEFEQVDWYEQYQYHFPCLKKPSCSWSFSHLALKHVPLL